MPKEAEALTPVRAISETAANVRLTHQARNHFEVTIPFGTDPETLLQPGYWKHLTHRFKNGNSITAYCEDRSWHATYEVRDIGPQHMTLVIVKADADGVCRYGSDDLPETETGRHRVLYAPGSQWYIQRVSDHVNVSQGKTFTTKTAAKAWLGQYLKDIAA